MLAVCLCMRAAITCRHAQCVEVLVCNGASPLVLDNARHNSALHWAASCCRADCVGRLLGSGAIFQMQSGQLIAIAGMLSVAWCACQLALWWSAYLACIAYIRSASL